MGPTIATNSALGYRAYLIRPVDGKVVWSADRTCCAGATNSGPAILTATGTYTVVIDFPGSAVGSASVAIGQAVTGGPVGPGEMLGGCNESLVCLQRQAEMYNATLWPVETSTGNFWHSFEGLSIPGRGLPLDFGFTYNSNASSVDGPLGFGWTHSYNTKLTFTPNATSPTKVTVNQGNGAQVNFTGSGSTWTAPPRAIASLVKNGDGTWTFTSQGRERLTFDATGRVTSIRDLTDPATGYTTTVSYPSSTQMVATDPAGRTLTFTLNGSGQITSAADSSGRSVSFSYTGSELTGHTGLDTGAGPSTWAFAYDSNHRMTKLRNPTKPA